MEQFLSPEEKEQIQQKYMSYAEEVIHNLLSTKNLSPEEEKQIKDEYTELAEDVIQNLLYLRRNYAQFEQIKKDVLASQNPKFTAELVYDMAKMAYYLRNNLNKDNILDEIYTEAKAMPYKSRNGIKQWFIPRLSQAHNGEYRASK